MKEDFARIRVRDSPLLVISKNAPLWVFVAVLLITYGFELFSFNLTIDEEKFADSGRLTRGFYGVQEGRWMLSAITLLVSNPVVPSVSTGVAIVLSGLTWWIVGRKYLAMTPWETAVVASLAGTLPVLPFMFQFSTVAVAIGVGTLMMAGFAAGISGSSWKSTVLAVVSGVIAIGIYDSFLIAMAVLVFANIYRHPSTRSVIMGTGSAGIAFLLSRAVGLLVSTLSSTPQSIYVGGFFDVGGLLSDPSTRIAEAMLGTWRLLITYSGLFGISSPWFGVAISVITVAALFTATLVAGTLRVRLLRVFVVLAIASIPFVTFLFAPNIPLRGMLYLPFIVLALSAMAAQGLSALRPGSRLVVSGVAVMLIAVAVLNNATVSNRLFVTAATTYSIDQELAFEIGKEKDRLLGGDGTIDMPAVVSSLHSWPEGAFTTKRSTFGGSFFNLNSTRGLQFLRAHGVLVHPASPEQSRKAWNFDFDGMPTYPNEGWVGIKDGVLLINFGGELPPL